MPERGGEGRESLPDTPLHRASFFVEDLKYGPGPGKTEAVTGREAANQLRVILDTAADRLDAQGPQHLREIDADQVVRDSLYYARSLHESLGVHPTLVLSIWIDALAHGIALAGGVIGEQRNPKGS